MYMILGGGAETWEWKTWECKTIIQIVLPYWAVGATKIFV